MNESIKGCYWRNFERIYKHEGLLRIASDMGKRQSKENLRSQEISTLDSIEHSDFSVLIEDPNGSPQPMSTFYIESAFQRVLTHPIPS